MSESLEREFINVLFSSIEGGRVAFPDALVAEIVDFQTVHSDHDDVPTWYLGKLSWRGILIPLVSLEAMNSGDFFRQGKQLKIIVIHGVYHREQLPYWAFVTSDAPKMMRVTKEGLPVEEAALGEIEKMRAEWNGDSLIMPAISLIENKIKNAM